MKANTFSKDFKNFTEANQFAAEMRATGYGAYVEEFWDLEGRFYSVICWEK